MVEEDPETYRSTVLPYVEEQTAKLQWIVEVCSLAKERERNLFSCDDFIINVDTKWRTHAPFPAATESRDSGNGDGDGAAAAAGAAARTAAAEEAAAVQEARRAERVAKVDGRSGFLRAWRLLCACRKPLVGHNCLYDLMFLF